MLPALTLMLANPELSSEEMVDPIADFDAATQWLRMD